MAFIPTPNAAHVDLGYRDDTGRTFSNGFDLLDATPYDLTKLGAVVSNVLAAWDELIAEIMGQYVSLVQVSARALDAANAPSTIITPALPLAGALAGVPLPLHSCVVVTFRSGLAGRSFRGRLFHTGMVQNNLFTQTQWTAAVAAAVGTQYNAFLTTFQTESLGEHVVISTQQGGITLAEGDPTPITSYVGRVNIGTQRGRVRP